MTNNETHRIKVMFIISTVVGLIFCLSTYYYRDKSQHWEDMFDHQLSQKTICLEKLEVIYDVYDVEDVTVVKNVIPFYYDNDTFSSTDKIYVHVYYVKYENGTIIKHYPDQFYYMNLNEDTDSDIYIRLNVSAIMGDDGG